MKHVLNIKVLFIKGKDNTNVILINLAGESRDSNFNNPIKITESINKSEFHKYVIENSLRALGIGKAIWFEVVDINKSRPLNQIHNLGEWQTMCKQPASSRSLECSYRTIYPVDTNLSLGET